MLILAHHLEVSLGSIKRFVEGGGGREGVWRGVHKAPK